MLVRFAEFHEDVDIPGRFSEVDKSNDIGMVDLMSYFYFGLDPFDDVHLQLGLGVVVALLLVNLIYDSSTCLSNSIFEITLHANFSFGLLFSQEINTWLYDPPPILLFMSIT